DPLAVALDESGSGHADQVGHLQARPTHFFLGCDWPLSFILRKWVTGYLPYDLTLSPYTITAEITYAKASAGLAASFKRRCGKLRGTWMYNAQTVHLAQVS